MWRINITTRTKLVKLQKNKGPIAHLPSVHFQNLLLSTGWNWRRHRGRLPGSSQSLQVHLNRPSDQEESPMSEVKKNK
ncbi:hypothetical protein Q5P01_010147 [Channa striata]|uniref:Uncharacterized protein n=1 Tax=Channa striata TaxID=64152 RepID=A0AA88SQ92_CHASR|nr:hypothetical protein Q5P01_010147 [Channa striata]